MESFTDYIDFLSQKYGKEEISAELDKNADILRIKLLKENISNLKKEKEIDKEFKLFLEKNKIPKEKKEMFENELRIIKKEKNILKGTKKTIIYCGKEYPNWISKNGWLEWEKQGYPCFYCMDCLDVIGKIPRKSCFTTQKRLDNHIKRGCPNKKSNN